MTHQGWWTYLSTIHAVTGRLIFLVLASSPPVDDIRRQQTIKTVVAIGQVLNDLQINDVRRRNGEIGQNRCHQLLEHLVSRDLVPNIETADGGYILLSEEV